MKTTINSLTTKFGCFLQAVGRVLTMPLPAIGELRTESVSSFSFKFITPTVPNSMKLRLDFEGLARLKDVECTMPDGSTITFPEICVSNIRVDAYVLPKYDENVVKFFDLKKPDDMPNPDVIGEINP